MYTCQTLVSELINYSPLLFSTTWQTTLIQQTARTRSIQACTMVRPSHVRTAAEAEAVGSGDTPLNSQTDMEAAEEFGDHSSTYWPAGWNFDRFSKTDSLELLQTSPRMRYSSCKPAFARRWVRRGGRDCPIIWSGWPQRGPLPVHALW
jgi:hypothetical protein